MVLPRYLEHACVYAPYLAGMKAKATESVSVSCLRLSLVEYAPTPSSARRYCRLG